MSTSQEASFPMRIWAVIEKMPGGGLALLRGAHVDETEAQRLARGLRGQNTYRGDRAEVVVCPGEIRVPA